MSAASTAQRTYVGPPFEAAKVYDAMRVGVVTCLPTLRFRTPLE